MSAAFIIYLPTSSTAAVPGERTNSIAGIPMESTVLAQRGRGRGRGRNWDDRWSRRRSGRWYGYKNYGQYRRTQVGNRRYRTVRRYYWRDGRRVSIWRRIFY